MLTRLIGRGVQLTLEAAPGGDVAVQGILVSAFDQPFGPDEGNLTFLVGPHLVELRFGRIEDVQVERSANGDGGPSWVRVLLEGDSVMEVRRARD